MAKLFGYPINLETEEEDGNGNGSSTDAEASRSGTQQEGEAIRFLGTSSDSGTVPMESESDLDSCFIDFFGRESHGVDTVGRNQMQRIIAFEEKEEEEIDLGLGIGAGLGLESGVSVTGDKEIDSGRVEVVTDLTPLEDDLFVVETGLASYEDDLFCEEEAMLMADEVLEWENLQNGLTWESEPLQANLFSEEEEDTEEEEEEEEEEEGDELALPYNANPFLENPERQAFPPVSNNDAFVEDFYEESVEIGLVDEFEGTDLMDLEYGDFLDTIHEFDGDDHGDYYDVFAQSFYQEPPAIMGTRPASKRVVDELPVVEITSEELSKGSVVCAICIGEVVVEEKVTRLPCRHYYHGDCIVPWLGMKNTCPVCRFELATDDVEYERSRR